MSRLEKYEEEDKTNEINKRFHGDAEFKGPVCK